MRSYRHSSRNAFAASFLKNFEQQDEPPTGPEADVAGPWLVEPVPGLGFGLFRAGESLARGFRPAAVFPDRWLALLAAAVLPGTGRDPLLYINKDADAEAKETSCSIANETQRSRPLAARRATCSVEAQLQRRKPVAA